MDLDKQADMKIQELQILEHNYNNLLMQKQSFQFEQTEVENALNEVSETQDEVYKTLGNVIIKAKKEKVIEELEEKKKILELRISTLEKQEKLIESKLKELREEANKFLSNNKK